MQEEKDYFLRAELRGHEEDVRGIVLAGASGIATSSRDRTVRLWTGDGPKGFVQSKVLLGHTHFVGPLLWVPPGKLPGAPEPGALISGSRDTTLIVWNVATAAAAATLHGHTHQVTALTVTADGALVSADVGGSIKIWRNGACSETLSASCPVLSLAALPDGGFLAGTGGPAFAVQVYSPGGAGYALAHSLSGHTDTVRSLHVMEGVGVLSGSHDCTARLWTFQGHVLAEFIGHTALIYSVTSSASGLIATGSEDNTLKVWRADGTCLASISHPGCVWAAAFLDDDDVLSGCADGVTRVWTADTARADAEAIELFNASLAAKQAETAAAQAKAQGGAGGAPAGLKLEDPSALQRPGNRDGETKVVRENGVGVAYSWDAGVGQWERIGEVVGGPGGDTMGVSSKVYNGRTYDYVFDVDVEDGAPPRKLPYNNGDNMYEVADRWLAEQGLPAGYREQIVNFISQNAGGSGAAPAPMPYNADPFTGGGAYVPSGGPAAGGGFSGGSADPFTGGGAYRPSGAAPAAAKPQLAFCPMQTYVSFDTATMDGILKKLREFNGAAVPEALRLSPEEEGHLELCGAALAAGAAPPAGCAALALKLLQWPAANLFPALDFARMAAHHAGPAAELSQEAAWGVEWAALKRAAAPPESAPNQLTGLRFLCNCFAHAGTRARVQAAFAEAVELFPSAARSANKSVRQAYATALLDFAVLAKAGGAGAAEASLQVLTALAEAVAGAAEDEETLFRRAAQLSLSETHRALVAVGTLAHGDQELSSLAKDMGMREAAEANKGRGSKLGSAASDVLHIIKP